MHPANTNRTIEAATQALGRRRVALGIRAMVVCLWLAIFAASAVLAKEAHHAAGPGGSAAPKEAHHAASPAVAHRTSSTSHVRNPHLHGFVYLNEAHRLHEYWWLHHWYHVGDYHTWLIAHTGAGIVEGSIESGFSSPVSGAKVWLRKGNGHAFRIKWRKHTTHADSQGNFVMYGVGPGTYTVVAQAGHTVAKARTHVYSGSVARVEIHLGHMGF